MEPIFGLAPVCGRIWIRSVLDGRIRNPEFKWRYACTTTGTVLKIFLKKKIYISGKMYLLIIHELTKAQPGQNQNVLAGTGLMGTCELRISSQ